KESFNLENNVGVELFRAGKIDEAADYFRKSIALQPEWSASQNNLGAVLERNGDLDGALAQYKKAIGISDYYLAYENIGGMLIKMKKYDEAGTFLENALRKFPANNTLRGQFYWIIQNKTKGEL
ncbi:MAG: tetratricopeptide repeat protein, partial [Patescibacteria group bacterium]